nr:uncharacterized protein CI109_005899 [Kwoniella shandongensis]KAA5525736.1 hypothetical protein CI109_005899 [Kwoniella shandongensis]
MLKESKPLEANTQPEEQQITRLADALKVPHYKTVLLVWSVYQFANMAICQGFYMVWGYTPVPSGGLGLSVENNGRLIAMAELAYVFTSPLMVPMIQKGLGAKRGLLLTTGIIPVEALGIPLVQWAATKGRKATYETLCLQYGMTTLHAYSLPIAHQFFVACFDDYPHLRATGMALSLIAGSAGKATGPAVGGWLYSYSTQFPAGSVGRQISWTVLFCLVLPAVILTSFIPKQLEKKAGSGHGGDEEEVEGLLHNHAE